MEPVSTISSNLIRHVRNHYEQALREIISGIHSRYGVNGYSDHAIPSYILAVATVEAFVNESLLTKWSKLISKNSSLWKLPEDFWEKLELANKLIILPELLFGKSFKRDEQPYQDMIILIKIRNTFVHFKMKNTVPKYVSTLDQRGITLQYRSKGKGSNADFAWTHKLSSSEGIRWAHNTACSVIQVLSGYAPHDRLKSDPILQLAPIFQTIPDEYPIRWFEEHGCDPKSIV